MISGHHQKCCQGYTLIELMIAAALSIFIVTILNGIFVKTAKFMEEIKATGNLLQTGQYLVSFLANEVSMAGFYGEFDLSALLGSASPISVPPEICQTLNRPKITEAMPYAVSGKNNVAKGYRICGSERVKPGTDVLLVRRVSAQKLTAKSKLKSGEFYVYSLVDNFDVLWGSGSIPSTEINTVSIRQWQQTIYYLSADNIFKRRRYLKGRYAPAEPLAEGVYDFQLEYGLRQKATLEDCTLSTGLGFLAAPLSAAQWQQMVAVRVYLLLKDSWRGGDQPKITLNYANHQVEIAKGETHKLLEFTVPIMNAQQKN
jgi:type IV pilus assembly protein PilW